MLFKEVLFKTFRVRLLLQIVCLGLTVLLQIKCLRLTVFLQIICLFSTCFCFDVASGKTIIVPERSIIQKDASIDIASGRTIIASGRTIIASGRTINVSERTIIPKDSSFDVASLVARRYGHADAQTIEAWKILAKMGYQPGAYFYPTPNTVLEFPSFSKVLRIEHPAKNYSPSTWLSVWDQMIQAIPTNKDNEIFMADLMQISASVLFRNATYLHFRCAHAFDEKDKKDLKRFSSEYLAVIAQIDHLIYGINFNEKFQKTLSPKCTPEFKHCISNYHLIRWKLWLDYSLSYIFNHHKFDSSFIAEKIGNVEKNNVSHIEHSIGDKALVDKPVNANLHEQIDFVHSLYLRFRDARLSDLD